MSRFPYSPVPDGPVAARTRQKILDYKRQRQDTKQRLNMEMQRLRQIQAQIQQLRTRHGLTHRV